MPKVSARAAMFLNVVFLLALCLPAHAQQQTFHLDGSSIPGTLPAQAGHNGTKPTDNLIAGKPIVLWKDVTEPTATWYPAPNAKTPTPTVMVFPGGGYYLLAVDLEGTEICQWLNSIGVSALLVRYRVPGDPQHAQPLEDAEAALKLLHTKATAWNVDVNHIGVIGFSAGGNLAARLTAAMPGALQAQILIYPAYLWDEKYHQLRENILPTAKTPPSFLVQAENDPVDAMNVLKYYESLMAFKVSSELHIYAKGGHGYGMRPTDLPITHWPQLAATWLQGEGFGNGGAQ